MSSAHPAFVSPAELKAAEARIVAVLGEALATDVERLEARALRAERAILRVEERLDELAIALARAEDRLNGRLELHDERALERRVIALERLAR